MFRNRRWVVALLVFALAFGREGGPATAAPPSPNPWPSSPALSATADGLILEWRAALPDLTRRGDGSVGVTISGDAQSDTPGAPQWPLTSQLVALPTGSRPSLEILQAEETDLPWPGRLALAPRPSGVQRDAEGNVIGGRFVASTEPLVLEAQADAPVSLTLLGAMRGVTLARLIFSPVRPATDHLRVTTRIQVALKFNVRAVATLEFGFFGKGVEKGMTLV